MFPVPEPRPQRTKKHGLPHKVPSSPPVSLWLSRKPDLGRGTTRLSSPEESQHQQGPHTVLAGVAKSLQLMVCLCRHASPTGLLLTALVAVVYVVALLYEE